MLATSVAFLYMGLRQTPGLPWCFSHAAYSFTSSSCWACRVGDQVMWEENQAPLGKMPDASYK